MQIRGPRRKTALLLAVGAVAVGVGVAAYATHLLRRSELQSVDARYSIRDRRERPRGVVVVGIDLATLHVRNVLSWWQRVEELAHVAGKSAAKTIARTAARARTPYYNGPLFGKTAPWIIGRDIAE